MISTFGAGAAERKRQRPRFGPKSIAPATRSAAICLILGAGPALSAARPDAVEVIRTLAAQDAAVLRVGERLAVAATPFCPNATYSAGMTIQQLGQYGEPYRAAAQEVLGVTNRPTVTLVAAGGGAEHAGIRPGDVITSIDGHAFAEVPLKHGAGDFATTAAAHDLIDAALADGHAQLSVSRRGQPLEMTIVPRRACRARFDVRAGRSNNASADGTYVQVSSDLVGQARGDGELAAIMAHELSHNILGHRGRLRVKGSRLSVRDTEVEADRLSVYLLDAAGYPWRDAVAFWQHWGPANDLGILSDRSHPGWKKRIGTIETEAARIASLKAAGQPVAPPPDLRRPD